MRSDGGFAQLPRYRSASRGWVVVLLAAAVIGWGVGALMQNGLLAIGVPLCSGMLLVVIAALSLRNRARREVTDPMVRAMSLELGATMPTRTLVRLDRWTKRWGVGEPQRIICRYASQKDDPRMIASLRDIALKRTGTSWEVTAHDSRRCQVVLEPTAVLDANDPFSNARRRAEAVMGKLFGESSQAKVVCDDKGVVTRVVVSHDRGPNVTLEGYRRRLENVVDAMLPGSWRSQWDLESDKVAFELRPVLPKIINLEVDEEELEPTYETYANAELAIATDEDAGLIAWRPKHDAHALIVGGTGSGKTKAEQALVCKLANQGFRIWILDGKRIEFLGFGGWPNVEIIASSIGDQIRMIHAAHDLMEERYDKIENGLAVASDFEALVLVIDEYTTFRDRVRDFYRGIKQKGDPPQPPVLALMANLMRLARTAMIHIAMGLQRPDAEILGGEMRDNMSWRMSMGRLSPQGAVMMWDSPAIGVVRTPPGQAMVINRSGDPVRAKVHFVPDPSKDFDDASKAHIERVRPSATRYPRKMFRTPVAVPDLDGEGLLIEPTYSDYATAPIVPWAPRSDRVAGGPAVIRSLASQSEGEDEDLIDAVTEDDGYAAEESARAGEISVGDLVLPDPDLGVWGVVVSVEVDLVDEDQTVISFADVDTGDEEFMSVGTGELLTLRRPHLELAAA